MSNSRTIPFLQLMRLANVFTAMADIAMGYVVVQQSWLPWLPFLLLLIASAGLYTSGMVLNDLFDLELDRVERPERPLPAGIISPAEASRLGWGLLAIGTIAGLLPSIVLGLGWVGSYDWGMDWIWRSGAITLVLAATIVAYDAGMKRTILGPMFMGGCRFFNVLLGMSVFPAALDDRVLLGFSVQQLLIAGGIGVYISGVTLFARSEATQSRRLVLVLAVLVMGLGFALLGLAPSRAVAGINLINQSATMWPFLLGLVFLTLLRGCIVAILDPRPDKVMVAVKQLILTLIVLDASLCLVFAPSQTVYGVIVIGLILPTLWLGRVVRST
jgi:4-hydroxybenzoate polyprenyltransferase